MRRHASHKTCKHGYDDTCEMTGRITVENMLEGTKAQTISYFCKLHRCFGSAVIFQENCRKVNILDISEPDPKDQ